jgi:hypothetical protein
VIDFLNLVKVWDVFGLRVSGKARARCSVGRAQFYDEETEVAVSRPPSAGAYSVAQCVGLSGFS